MQIPWIQTENIPLCYRPGSNSTLLIFLLPFLRFAREGCVPICWYLKKPQHPLGNCQLLCFLNNLISATKQCRGTGIGCLVVQPWPDTFSEPKMFSAEVPCGQCLLLKDCSGEAYSYQGPFGNISDFFCYILWLII